MLSTFVKILYFCRKKMKQLLLTLTGIFCVLFVEAQPFNWWTKSEVAKPALANMYSGLSKIELIKAQKVHPQYYKGEIIDRPLNELQTGFRLPVFSFQKPLASGLLKTALDMPVAAVLLIDMYEEETAPVINNDYRFGLAFNAVYYPDALENAFIKNISFRYVPMFHESTHIGDEYALHGYSSVEDFMRINVSYEAWQLFLGLNSPDTLSGNLLSAEIGYQRLMPYKAGFYNTDTFEVQGLEVLPGSERDIWLFRFNAQKEIGFMNKRRARVLFSSELRNEIKFGYTSLNPERRVWSVNALTAFSFETGVLQPRMGFFLRYYYGLNPYGQLRDQYNFQLFGAGIFIQ
jgi:hypothetical protein